MAAIGEILDYLCKIAFSVLNNQNLKTSLTLKKKGYTAIIK